MLTLNAQERDLLGKKTKALREKGLIPAVLYGKKEKTVSISIPFKDFLKIWKEAGESTLIELALNDKKETVIIHEVAFDPVKNIPIHADLYRVEMDKLIRAEVPLLFIGESAAVKNLGGVLVKVIREAEIEALPKDLPHEIPVDIAKLQSFDDQITVKDLSLPAGVKVAQEPNDIVAFVEEPKEEEIAETETKPKLEDIEVVGRKEKEEAAAEPKEKQEKEKAKK